MGKETKPVVIDGEFQVIGEAPKREPVIKSWLNLIVFLVLTGGAMVLRYWQITR